MKVRNFLRKCGLTALLLIDEQRQQPPRKRAACNTVSQNPMGQRAMHEGGFRKNELRNLLLKVSGSTLFDSTASALFEALPTSASR